MKNIYGKIKSGLKVAALAAGLTMALTANSQAGDDTFKIARDKTIPGKFGRESCDTFAKELYSRLVSAGGEAYYIVYDWRDTRGGSGRHAIVVYRDSHGRYFGMDQTRRQPIWLAGQTPSGWVSWFNGPGDVRVVRSVTDESLSGQYADLSRPSRVSSAKANRMLAMQ